MGESEIDRLRMLETVSISIRHPSVPITADADAGTPSESTLRSIIVQLVR